MARSRWPRERWGAFELHAIGGACLFASIWVLARGGHLLWYQWLITLLYPAHLGYCGWRQWRGKRRAPRA
jgi:hypothetical protein